LKKAEKTRLPPLTANHRHFCGVGVAKKPIVLMVFLSAGLLVKVLVGDDLSRKKYRRK